VAAHLDGDRRSARIYLATACDIDDLRQACGDRIFTEQTVAWDPARRAVSAAVRERLDHLILSQRPSASADPGQVAAALIDGIAELGLGCLPWTRAARAMQQRVAFVRSLDLGRDYPDLGDQALAATLDQWLLPHLSGCAAIDDLRGLELKGLLAAMLTRDQRRLLDELAPSHIDVAGASRLALDYSGPAPVLAVKVQAMFGAVATPTLARGTVPVVLHLLSPAGRPVQITRDLAGFWKDSYHQVRKQMKGRYPKHHWPEDPLGAAARVKRKG